MHSWWPGQSWVAKTSGCVASSVFEENISEARMTGARESGFETALFQGKTSHGPESALGAARPCRGLWDGQMQRRGASPWQQLFVLEPELYFPLVLSETMCYFGDSLFSTLQLPL